MVIALNNKWIWDSWYAHDGEQWHAYFLQADKSLGDPALRHWNVSQGHAVSDNLRDWTHLGTSFAPADEPAWDDFTTWTGSVIHGEDGQWHLFYTGTCRAEEGKKQRIGHATSADMHNWRRVGDGLCLDIGDQYEEFTPAHWHDRAFRDPWVMKDPSGNGWIMFFTARAPNVPEPNAAGAIGFANSADLMTWTLRDPVFVGGFGQLEVPQVFDVDGRWYCMFCTGKDHWSKAYTDSQPQEPVTGNHYLIADDPRGPWTLAPGPFFDGGNPCHRYAGRILKTQDGLMITGFSDGGDGPGFGGFVLDPVRVDVAADGRLELREEI